MEPIMLTTAVSEERENTATLQELKSFHDAQLMLCSRLENIADLLPHDIDNQETLLVARQILPLVKNAHAFEERAVFGSLKTGPKYDETTEKSIQRLRFEHWEDESFAEELRDELISYVAGNRQSNVEKLSYMLRGFFENLRRHIAFEQEHIMPLMRS